LGPRGKDFRGVRLGRLVNRPYHDRRLGDSDIAPILIVGAARIPPLSS
jgi:hypothetical protein